VSQVVLVDTDFLSALLKIERLELVRDFYGVDELTVPTAVYREISATDLMEPLSNLPWLAVRSPEQTLYDRLMAMPDLVHLGNGEMQAIALALEQKEETLLLTNDNGARHSASTLGIEVVNIPAFLLGCKTTGFLDLAEVTAIVVALEQKDHYGFRREIRDLLTSA